MKKKLLMLVIVGIVAVAALCLCGCSKSEPLNLDGEWATEKNEDSNMEATIKGDVIEIYWMTEDTKALYWAGSVVVPGEDVMSTDEYSWTSQANSEKNDEAMLASTAKTKKFKYKDGKITYKASALGVTTTMTMSRK